MFFLHFTESEIKAVSLSNRFECVDELPELDIKVNETHLCESGVDAFTKPCIVSIHCLKLLSVSGMVFLYLICL